jgi:hypothetical protein
MPDATSKLDILITAKDNASGAIGSVENSLKGLNDSAETLSQGFEGILGAAGIAGIGALAEQVGESVVEMTKMAAESDRLQSSFDHLASAAGQSGDAMLAALKKASDGTISNTDLMASANKAMLLGVADSSSQMGQLMEVAAARAKAFGVSTGDAFDTLVEGLGRLSPRMLESLGLTIDTGQAYDNYAKSIGTTAANLDEQQKRQALVNVAIQDSKQLVEDNAKAGSDLADSFERYDAAVTNAKVAIGETFAGPGALALTLLTTYIEGQTKMLENEVGAWDKAKVAVTNFATGAHDVTAAVEDAALAEGKADAITHDLTFGMIDLGTAAENTGHKLLDMGVQGRAAMDAFNAAMAESRAIAGSIGSAAAGAGSLFAQHLGGDAGLAKQKQVTDELNTQVKAWEDQGYTQKQINEVLLPGMVASLNQADSGLFQAATHTAQLSGAAKQANQAFDDMKSKAQSVLQGALDPGVGVDPAKLLPREDALNEDARRLADVAVNGFASPWADYFKAKFPDMFKGMLAAGDIKTGAAQLLQDFQDGLEPQLLDKEKAKERVRRMILGEQDMASLATEIAQELSGEMGISMQQAMQATQQTIGGSSGLGTTAAQQFSDGASAALDDAGSGGGAFVSKFADQMRAQYSLLQTAGADAAKMWGDAFLAKVGDRVPPALIRLLTDLITPNVVAQLAQRGTLTGATP